MDDFRTFVVLLADIYANLYMRAFNFSSQSLTNFVQQTGTPCHVGIQSQFRGKNAAELGNFDGMLQDILPVAGTVIEPSQQLDHFVVDAVNIGFQNSMFAFCTNPLFHFSFCLFHHFFNFGRVDSAVRNEFFQSDTGNFTPNLIKTGKCNGFRCIIDNQVHAGEGFQCPDVSALSADDTTFHFIVRQRHNRNCRFRNLIGCTLCNGEGDVVSCFLLTVILELLLILGDFHCLFMHQFIFQMLQDIFLCLFPGEF